MTINTIILAAGQGTRMKSLLPKVLQPLAGKPLLQYVVDAAIKISSKKVIVVCGYKADLVKKSFNNFPVDWALQKQQLGTGDAVSCAMSQIEKEADQVLILNGDVPLIKEQTLQNLINNTPKNAIGFITAVVDEPSGLGRIERDNRKEVVAIVEEKEATEKQKKIKEINAGIYLIPAKSLSKWIVNLSNDNAQGEKYLTDIISLAKQEGKSIHAELVENEKEIFGINNKLQLAELERYYQKEKAKELMLQGVTIIDQNRIDIRGEVNVGIDVILDLNVVLQGNVTIEDNVKIGANVIIKDSYICSGTEILPNSIIDSAKIGESCAVGPFARIRPNTKLQDKVKIGNFVEVKNSNIAMGAKASHLSYLGDAEIGENVNIGAGVITCNYDGAYKHKTIIGNNAYIGADAQLIAPIVVGKGSTIAAGTTVMKNIPNDVLVLNTKQQQHIKGWNRPQKVKAKESEKN